MRSKSLLQSSVYRFATACSVALVVFVVTRAPIWNSVMAGARAQLGDGQVALASAAWLCSDRSHSCSTTVAGGPLVAQVGWNSERHIECTASFKGRAVACSTRLRYAPRLKPFLELGELPGVSLAAALRERPWRMLDAGLLDEMGPLHLWAGFVCACMLALGLGARVRRCGLWWSTRVGLATLTFLSLCGVWITLCVALGYID